MSAIYGLALVSASVLLFAYMFKAKNAPEPARWTRSKILLQIAIFTLFIGVIFGAAVIVQFLANIPVVEFGILETGLLCAIVIVTAVIWRSVRSTLPPPS